MFSSPRRTAGKSVPGLRLDVISPPSATCGASTSAAPPRPIAHGAGARATAPGAGPTPPCSTTPSAGNPREARSPRNHASSNDKRPRSASRRGVSVFPRGHFTMSCVVAEQGGTRLCEGSFFAGMSAATPRRLDLRGVARVRRHQRRIEFANCFHLRFEHLTLPVPAPSPIRRAPPLSRRPPQRAALARLESPAFSTAARPGPFGSPSPNPRHGRLAILPRPSPPPRGAPPSPVHVTLFNSRSHVSRRRPVHHVALRHLRVQARTDRAPEFSPDRCRIRVRLE